MNINIVLNFLKLIDMFTSIFSIPSSVTIFLCLFYSCCIKPMIFKYFFLLFLNILHFIIDILYLNKIITDLTDSSDVMSIFMPTTGFKKGHDTMKTN